MRRVGKKPKQAPETMLDQHIRSIGFSTREQYETWCRALGFPIVLQKHRKQLAREIAVANSLRQNSLRHAQEPRARDALGWVLDVCNGEDPANIRVAHIEYVAKRLKQADASISAERPSAQSCWISFSTYRSKTRNCFLNLSLHRLGSPNPMTTPF